MAGASRLALRLVLPGEFQHYMETGVSEPYEKFLRMISGDYSPQEAAQALGPNLGHVWQKPVALPVSAPAHFQAYMDSLAWRRFEASTPESRVLVCAHYLYRAAESLQDTADVDASLLLMKLAKDCVRVVLLVWLGGRECPHCIELLKELQGQS